MPRERKRKRNMKGVHPTPPPGENTEKKNGHSKKHNRHPELDPNPKLLQYGINGAELLKIKKQKEPKRTKNN